MKGRTILIRFVLYALKGREKSYLYQLTINFIPIMKKVIVSTVLPLVSLGLYAIPAMADIENSPVVVKNTNSAVVVNQVVATANSGWNIANGGMAGNGGKGGSVVNSDHDNTGGDGGKGGDAGMGGLIITGDAGAGVILTNDVNNNDTQVGNCECQTNGDLEDSKTKVKNDNGAVLGNGAAAAADTGNNTTNGGEAGKGGKGGSIVGSDHGNVGGMGGSAGMGGAGGTITTGMSGSLVTLVNVLNTNITRINR